MVKISPPLTQGVGYGIVLGLGFLFAFAMILTTFVLKRYNSEIQTSEMFSTAGRTVKSGLVASAVVSSWTWAATLLQSSSVAYNYGVSGPFWYASGATVQIILFATLAIELKRRAPNAHTFLEVIRARYGAITHFVYITFGLMTNTLVTAMLLTGGSAVVTSLTGVPTAAACYLLPVGVVLYTTFGGIKATFLTDYAHTVVILVILLMFAFVTYATSSILGSPSKVFDLLQAASVRHPVEGNAGGSYLTMRSKEGGIFFLINLIGNFSTVFCDNGYYNKAIAASPVHALPGYIAGGLAWFAIPWLAATTMGLSALAIENNPVFPTYPDRMDPADVSAGLVLPTAATALMGKGGAVATLLLVFMAVTSAMSAELIAVSSIFTYDIYQTYFDPKASGKTLINMSHICVVVFSILIASFSTGLHYIGISMGYLYLMMGVIVSSAVIPAALTLLWSKQNWAAATFSPPIGFACSLIAWLVTAKKLSGTLTVASTGANYPMLAGNVVCLFTPAVIIPIVTYALGPQNYDWVSMKEIQKGDDHDFVSSDTSDVEDISDRNARIAAAEASEQASLERSGKIARWLSVTLSIALLVLWPMPMYGTGYIFSKKFFTGWVSVGILWMFCSGICVGIYPLWEGRHTVKKTTLAIWADLTGKSGAVRRGTIMGHEVEEKTGTSSPVAALSEKPKEG